MSKILVATDSHSGLSPQQAKELGIRVLPMPFYIGEQCYYEEVSLTRELFFERLTAGEKVSTSQPSPEEVLTFWREGLKEYDEIVYIPMSSGLSGSCNTAMVLANDEEFEDKVYVVDNGRISTPLVRSVLDAKELAEEGFNGAEMKRILEEAKENMSIYIAVETLEYLKKGGRISAATAAVGSLLNIKPILKLGTELLENYKNSRGMKKAKKEMLEALKNDLETTYREYYEKGEVYLLAATSADEETSKLWVEEIKEAFPGMEVLSGNLSLGISCHVGPGGLGVGCSCKPRR